jgi:sulfoacetaldehyde dehydrogenase
MSRFGAGNRESFARRARQGAPADLILCLEKPSIPLAQELMSICDLTIATGGVQMVRAAYGSGKPAYGVGAGNATVVVDETADIAEAAMNTRISKTQNHGSGCSCDGNLLVEASVYDAFLDALQKEGGYLVNAEEKSKLEAAMWDAEGHRTIDTVARAAGVIAQKAGFALPDGKSFIIVKKPVASPPLPARSCHPYWRSHRSRGFTAQTMVSGSRSGQGYSVGLGTTTTIPSPRVDGLVSASWCASRTCGNAGSSPTACRGRPASMRHLAATSRANISVKHYMKTTWVSFAEREIPSGKNCPGSSTTRNLIRGGGDLFPLASSASPRDSNPRPAEHSGERQRASKPARY